MFHWDEGMDTAVLEDTFDSLYLKLDQTVPQTIINGVPLMTTPVDEYGSENQLVNKDYCDSAHWLIPPIIEWYDPTGGLPGDGHDPLELPPVVGDRYGADDTGYGWTEGYIYEWDGASWVESEPEEGWMMWDLWEMILWFFFSGGWEEVGDNSYVRKPSDTMGGTLTFSEIYEPSPASSAVEPAIRAKRDIVITSGHKLIFDGA